MSVICQTFVQNAWRSDLCSNCFKCLDEHNSTHNHHSSSNNNNNRMTTTSTTHRYMPQATSIYQSRGISSTLKWRLSEPIYERVARRDFGSQTPPKTNHQPPAQEQQQQQQQQEHDNNCNNNRGILIKDNVAQEKKLLKSRPTVDFASEEALVIGYGGNDYDSDQSPWEMASDDESIDLDLLDDTDEDRKISRLTRNNTEFNSSNKNLDPVTSNNNRNNNNNASPAAKLQQQQPLTCVTRNDIGSTTTPQKELNRYYFSTNIEPLKSYLHGNNNNNDSQVVVKVDNIQKAVDNNSRAPNLLLQDDFSPLNTRTYSMLSEITNKSSGSDSDYSTCRLTPGDSTDSESFQDAEESRPLPCQSFLHGSFPRKSSPKHQSSSDDKKYDGGSSTSGDVSNLSDDSDTGEQRTFKSRTARSKSAVVLDKSSFDHNLNDKSKSIEVGSSLVDGNRGVVQEEKKSSPVIDAVKKSTTSKSSAVADSKKGVVALDKKTTTSPVNDVGVNEPVKKTATSEIDNKKGVVVEKKSSSQKETFDATPDAKKASSAKRDTSQIESKTVGGQSNKQTQPPPPPPNPPVEINLRNIIALNESSETTPSKPKSSPPRITKSSDTNPQRNVRKQAPVREPEPSINKQGSDEDECSSSSSSSPEAITNRQSKLAALALELELARRDSELKSAANLNNNNNNNPPPEVKAAKCIVSRQQQQPQDNNPAYPTIKKNGGMSCASRLAAGLPDVLQDSPSPGKLKKNRFSLKKLLKRSKDITPSSKEANNPKAWKKQTFDRNRLSLEIVHPMDLSPPTSGDSTPTEEGQYVVSTHPGRGAALKGGYSRARSLSALPQLGSEYQDPSVVLLDGRKVDTMPTRKAGTVAERKKNRPSLVRTPSCSALPNRPSAQDRTPPPKPPPPPKCMQPPPPPPPPHQHRKPPTCSPARPPPPKIPETKSRIPSGDSSRTDQRDSSNLDKEYANLGDIRSLMTPKKPQRPSAVSVSRDSSDGSKPHHYAPPQPLVQEEEDHYTYLDDDAEVKSSKSPCLPASAPPVHKESSISSKRNAPASVRPWLDLQTSYAAIAAANYESLAEIITTSMSEGAELFQDGGKSLRWRDFTIHDEEAPQQVAGDRTIYTATYKNKGNKVLLMVSPKHHSGPQNARHQVRYPVLATFTDAAPPHHPVPSSVYALHHPAQVFTLSQFPTRADTRPSHLHLRDTCFVLLQLIHALKGLQAEGTEDLDWVPDRLLLVTLTDGSSPPPDDASGPPSLVLFPEDKARAQQATTSGDRVTLCQAISASLFRFLGIQGEGELGACRVRGEPLPEPVAHTFRAISLVLAEEKAQSLSQAKGLLEYMLWGPVDLGATADDDDGGEGAVQRWLDLQRAQVLKSAVAAGPCRRLGAYEEFQLVFLLQASVKSLKSVIAKLCEC